MSYLNTHPKVVLTLACDERDARHVTSETFADSDHAGDKETSKSISGALSFIMGEHGAKALIAWFAVQMRNLYWRSGGCSSVSCTETIGPSADLRAGVR
eukprot:217067-Pyramimonas_sp.AAC.1